MIVLMLSSWSAVRSGSLTGAEAWWWLSVPYSAMFPIVMAIFRLQGLTVHVLILFVIWFFVTGLVAVAWTLTAWFSCWRASVIRRQALTVGQKFRLGLASVLFVVLVPFFVSLFRGAT